MSTVKEHDRSTVQGTTSERYSLVSLALEWLSVLQKTDECKGMGQSELVKRALEDITSGSVTSEDIVKAHAKQKEAPAAETAETPASEKVETKKAEKGKK